MMVVHSVVEEGMMSINTIDRLILGLASVGSRIPGSSSIVNARRIVTDFLDTQGINYTIERLNVEPLNVFYPDKKPSLIIDGIEVPAAAILNSLGGDLSGKIRRIPEPRSSTSLSCGVWSADKYYITNEGGEPVAVVLVSKDIEYVAPVPLTPYVLGVSEDTHLDISPQEDAMLPHILTNAQGISRIKGKRGSTAQVIVAAKKISSLDNIVVDLHKSSKKDAKTIYLIAHLDSVPFYDEDGNLKTEGICGIVDNASGVVTALNISSLFLQEHDPTLLKDYNVRLLITDGEEYGRLGALLHFYDLVAYTPSSGEEFPYKLVPKDRGDIQLALNLDSFDCSSSLSPVIYLHDSLGQLTLMKIRDKLGENIRNYSLNLVSRRDITDAMALGRRGIPFICASSNLHIRLHTDDDTATDAGLEKVTPKVYRPLIEHLVSPEKISQLSGNLYEIVKYCLG